MYKIISLRILSSWCYIIWLVEPVVLVARNGVTGTLTSGDHRGQHQLYFRFCAHALYVFVHVPSNLIEKDRTFSLQLNPAAGGYIGNGEGAGGLPPIFSWFYVFFATIQGWRPRVGNTESTTAGWQTLLWPSFLFYKMASGFWMAQYEDEFQAQVRVSGHLQSLIRSIGHLRLKVWRCPANFWTPLNLNSEHSTPPN